MDGHYEEYAEKNRFSGFIPASLSTLNIKLKELQHKKQLWYSPAMWHAYRMPLSLHMEAIFRRSHALGYLPIKMMQLKSTVSWQNKI